MEVKGSIGRKDNKCEFYAVLRAGGRAVMRGTADPVHSGSNPDLPFFLLILYIFMKGKLFI